MLRSNHNAITLTLVLLSFSCSSDEDKEPESSRSNKPNILVTREPDEEESNEIDFYIKINEFSYKNVALSKVRVIENKGTKIIMYSSLEDSEEHIYIKLDQSKYMPLENIHGLNDPFQERQNDGFFVLKEGGEIWLSRQGTLNLEQASKDVISGTFTVTIQDEKLKSSRTLTGDFILPFKTTCYIETGQDDLYVGGDESTEFCQNY